MSSRGRSWLLVGTIPIRCRTPIPSEILPKMVCLPSNHCVGASVMKNWLPFVSGPALAIAKIPAPKTEIGESHLMCYPENSDVSKQKKKKTI